MLMKIALWKPFGIMKRNKTFSELQNCDDHIEKHRKHGVCITLVLSLEHLSTKLEPQTPEGKGGQENISKHHCQCGLLYSLLLRIPFRPVFTSIELSWWSYQNPHHHVSPWLWSYRQVKGAESSQIHSKKRWKGNWALYHLRDDLSWKKFQMRPAKLPLGNSFLLYNIAFHSKDIYWALPCQSSVLCRVHYKQGMEFVLSTLSSVVSLMDINLHTMQR